MDSQFTTQTIDSYSAPGSYFGFNKYDSAASAQDAFQISPDWSDCKLRGEFDTLDIIDDMYVPTTYGNSTNILEPITKSYPEYGSGGIQQMKIDSDILFNFKDVKIIGD